MMNVKTIAYERILTTETSHWTTASSVTLLYAPGRIKRSYFVHAIISPTLKNKKWLWSCPLKFWNIFLVAKYVSFFLLALV